MIMLDDIAGQIVFVIMHVGVYRETFGRPMTEKSEVFRVLFYGFRMADTANVMIETDNAISRRHHQVQIVRDQQDTAFPSVANSADQFVEIKFTFEIYALYGFIEYQQIGLPQHRTGKHHPLLLTTR